MADLGMTFAELRVVFGRNIIDLSDAEIDRARAMVEARGMRVLSIASPVLKCTLPDAPPVAPYIQQDVFGSAYTFADQPRLCEPRVRNCRADGRPDYPCLLVLADRRSGRVFRSRRICAAQPCRRGGRRGVIIGIENEHACNIATGEETARLLAAVDHPALQVIWDPANAYVAGEIPFPDGYAQLSVSRIAHVHAKDCHVRDHVPVFGPLGEMGIDWRGQLAALARDGYRGGVSLETHWTGPGGDKFQGSIICGRSSREELARGL